jgi:hypothetical protein
MRTQSYVFGKRDCCPMAYLLSPSTFAITPLPTHPHTHTHTHTHTHWCHTMADQLYSCFEAVLFADCIMVQKILLKFMEIEMNIFAWLKIIASIILATIVLACRIVLIFRNAVSRYIILIAYPYLPIVQADICRTLFMSWGVINSV